MIPGAARTLAERLEPVRLEYGPIIIKSGFRCWYHNAASGGKPYSAHLLGLAADIRCHSDPDRFRLISLLLKHHFRRIGIGQFIIHADISTLTGPVIWTYYT